MAFEKRDNSGAIFKNTRKTSENSPPLSGNATINGEEFWVSGWTKVDKNGDKWISLSFKAKNPSAAQSQQAQQNVQIDIDEDTIPF